jgi:hypothetical protein
MTHTFGRTSLDEGSARRRELYLTAHDIQKRERSVYAPGGIPADLRLRPRFHRDRLPSFHGAPLSTTTNLFLRICFLQLTDRLRPLCVTSGPFAVTVAYVGTYAATL